MDEPESCRCRTCSRCCPWGPLTQCINPTCSEAHDLLGSHREPVARPQGARRTLFRNPAPVCPWPLLVLDPGLRAVLPGPPWGPDHLGAFTQCFWDYGMLQMAPPRPEQKRRASSASSSATEVPQGPLLLGDSGTWSQLFNPLASLILSVAEGCLRATRKSSDSCPFSRWRHRSAINKLDFARGNGASRLGREGTGCVSRTPSRLCPVRSSEMSAHPLQQEAWNEATAGS